MALTRGAGRRRFVGGIAVGAGLAVAGCGGVPVAPQPDGKRTTPRRTTGRAPGVSIAPGGIDPASIGEWRGADDPFALGVASGLPRTDGATIWTRLAPRPRETGGGMDPTAVRVRWSLWDAREPGAIRHGIVAAEPEWAHSVRVELSGLEPGRDYRYRFESGDATSATGRFHTAPAAGEGDRMRIVFASCQHYEHGFYSAWRHAVADAPDLIVFLGDYIYEGGSDRVRVRAQDPGVPTTLAGYRRRHATYRADRDLQAAHAACAWVPTWDDHEVDNDYGGELSQHGAPPAEFVRRRGAAYRAYFEHMPLPWPMAPDGASMRIHGHVDWGGLARLHVLDDRQYRAPQACSPPGHAGSRMVRGDDCAQRLEPSRSLLGAEQEAWFDASVRGSRARWNLVAQQTLMGRCDWQSGPGEVWWTDGWDGYPGARARLLASVRASGATNPIALGGDVHTFYAGELHEDFDRPGPKPAMVELVGGSITSLGPAQRRIDGLVAENPNLRWGAAARGYGRLDLSRGVARVAMRGVADATDAASGCATLREFEIRDGVGRLEG